MVDEETREELSKAFKSFLLSVLMQNNRRAKRSYYLRAEQAH